MNIKRTRYAAVRNNKTEVLIDVSNGPNYGQTRQEWIDTHWRNINNVGQARILTWVTKNKAIAALMKSAYTENVEYEIVPVVETLEFSEDKI